MLSGDFSGVAVSTEGVVGVGVDVLAVDDKSTAADTSGEISGISTQLIAGTMLVVIASERFPKPAAKA